MKVGQSNTNPSQSKEDHKTTDYSGEIDELLNRDTSLLNNLLPIEDEVEEVKRDVGDVETDKIVNFAAVPLGLSISSAVANGIYGVAIPASINGYNLTAALASIYTKGSSGTTTVQIRRYRAGVNADMLSTRITVSYNEYYAADGVIDTTKDDVATGDLIYVDIDTAAVSASGLSVALTFSP